MKLNSELCKTLYIFVKLCENLENDESTKKNGGYLVELLLFELLIV